MRSAICRTSSTMPRACCRAASASMSAFSLGNAEKQARAESRTRASASSSGSLGDVDASRLGAGDHLGQGVGGVGEVVDRRAGVDVGASSAGGPLDHRRVELVGGGLRDAGGQLVRLVDDDRVVLRQHRHAVDGVDGEQRVVGDDEVGVLGVLASPLGEALERVRAARRAEALAVVDAHLPPGALGVRRARSPGRRCCRRWPAPRPTRAARGPRRPATPRAPRRARPGRRARPRGCGAGRRSCCGP